MLSGWHRVSNLLGMSYSAPIRKLSVPGPMTGAEVAITNAIITRRKVFCTKSAGELKFGRKRRSRPVYVKQGTLSNATW
jgi:hypothetical protein